jgi:Rrf2 family protein
MISRAAEYALRTVVCLAEGGGHPSTARELSEATGIPESSQMKVLQALRRAGLVRSRRGQGGGFVVARPAREISIQEVIVAVESGGPGQWPDVTTDLLRKLRQRLWDGLGMMRILFESITVAEICGEDPSLETVGSRDQGETHTKGAQR